jgi:hypothetical protein
MWDTLYSTKVTATGILENRSHSHVCRALRALVGPAVSPDRNHVTIVLAFTVEKTPTSSAMRH